ncbi:cobalamin biosynthesis protein [Mycobacterium sp.]|uniref:cobalamin biosynthesis protein n=1 Tax=Mycobacterium sp. TaxID=1785 RepID=UPI0025F7F5E5|nr:cobalamin biosynthesis protein [Mycobacterium sp.]
MFGTTRRTRVAGVLVGYLADALLADPRVAHPVAGFGTAAGSLERITYRDSRVAGSVHATTLIATVVVAGAALQRRLGRGGVRAVAATAVATWVALGGTSLARVGSAMGAVLRRDDLDGARRLLPSLCGRDPATLDAAGLARATVESVAENTSDAQVAPLLWAAVAGVPGVLGYRAVNTLDAMIGHRSPRYARFGWAAARTDDAANYPAARATAALTVLCAPLVGGSPLGAVTAWRRDAGRHPSPNAGVVEAAFAGALGVQLGGPTQYHYQLQIRPALGVGRTPTVVDVERAVRLSRAVQTAALVVACVGLSVGGRSGR